MIDQTYRDKQDIAELLHRYALAVDTDDFGKMAGIFVQDATFSLVGMDAAEWHWSVAEYCEFVSAIVKQCDWVMHNSGNLIVEISQDTATAISYLNTAYGVKPGEHVLQFQVHSDQPVDVEIGARYRDQLIRTASGWRIGKRVCEVLFQRERPVARMIVAEAG